MIQTQKASKARSTLVLILKKNPACFIPADSNWRDLSRNTDANEHTPAASGTDIHAEPAIGEAKRYHGIFTCLLTGRNAPLSFRKETVYPDYPGAMTKELFSITTNPNKLRKALQVLT